MSASPKLRHLPRDPADREIRHHAYLLWEEAGCPAGRDRDIWLAAKELVHRRLGLPQPCPTRRQARHA